MPKYIYKNLFESLSKLVTISNENLILFQEVKSLIEPYLYEVTAKYKGSISAEHGMGSKKKNFISYSKSDSAISLMRNLKEVMDPKGILNPYKVLPDKF